MKKFLKRTCAILGGLLTLSATLFYSHAEAFTLRISENKHTPPIQMPNGKVHTKTAQLSLKLSDSRRITVLEMRFCNHVFAECHYGWNIPAFQVLMDVEEGEHSEFKSLISHIVEQARKYICGISDMLTYNVTDNLGMEAFNRILMKEGIIFDEDISFMRL